MTHHKINKYDWLFLLSYTFYLIVNILSTSMLRSYDSVNTIFQAIRYAAYLLAAIKLIHSVYRREQIPESVIIFGLVIMSAFVSDDKVYIFYLLFFWAARGMNARRIVKMCCFMQFILIAIMAVLSKIKAVTIVDDWVTDPATRARHTFGFEWANTVPTFFFFFTLCYIYLRKEKIRWFELVILEGVNFCLFKLTNTRASFALLSLALVMVFFLKYFWQNHKLKNWFMVAAPAVICVAAIYIHACYKEGSYWWDKINDLLSDRLWYGHDALKTYGVHLLGKHIEWVGFGLKSNAGKVYNYVDCSYMKHLLSDGLIFLILIILAYTLIMYKAVQMKDYYLQFALFFILVFSITEPRIIDLAYNPFPILAVTFWKTSRTEALELNRDLHYPHIRIVMPRMIWRKSL